MRIKTDPFTGNNFTPKRSNQLFETRENQIAFNNEKAKEKRNKKKKVDRTLDTNRNILISILAGKKEVSISKDYLMGAGFNFSYFSQSVKQENIHYQLVYEFGLRHDKENNLFVIKKLDL